ncbi:hypothetical protein DMN91_000449 [Ooceraea biroi]|uniref:Uncharacterized protein n=1 Tax=Ooceraea biroi TaxID=2015173 RepID=A0A3L8E2A0_OOCBI|nr:hypothetical protein DMN91_000449 [Ooceraea biroi]
MKSRMSYREKYDQTYYESYGFPEILRRQTISLPSLRNPAKNPLHCTDQMYKRDRVHHNFSKKLWNHLTKKIDAQSEERTEKKRKISDESERQTEREYSASNECSSRHHAPPLRSTGKRRDSSTPRRPDAG